MKNKNLSVTPIGSNQNFNQEEIQDYNPNTSSVGPFSEMDINLSNSQSQVSENTLGQSQNEGFYTLQLPHDVSLIKERQSEDDEYEEDDLESA